MSTCALTMWRPGVTTVTLLTLLLGLAGATGSEAQDQTSLKWATMAILAASALDEASTEYNLSQGHELMAMRDGSRVDVNSRETSPWLAWLQGNRPAMYAVSGALTAGGILALRELGRRGHPSLARVGLYVWSATRIHASIGNIQGGNAHRRYRRLAVSVSAL
jgi:hypothetical protein